MKKIENKIEKKFVKFFLHWRAACLNIVFGSTFFRLFIERLKGFARFQNLEKNKQNKIKLKKNRKKFFKNFSRLGRRMFEDGFR